MDNTACLIHDVIRGFTAFSGARIRCRAHWWPLPRTPLLIRLSQRDLLVTRRWKSFSSKQGPFWTVMDIG